MARHFSYHNGFGESHHNSFGESQRREPSSRGGAMFAPGVIDPPVRVVLIAIRHDPRPPVFHGRHLLQRLQALLAMPGDQEELNPQSLHAGFAFQSQAEAFEETPLLPPRVLPPLPLPSAPGEQTALQPRLVRGDILSDSAGRLYERFGRQVRPLQRVVSGPRGEVLELVSGPRATPTANRWGAAANKRPANSRAGADSQAGSQAGSHAGSSAPESRAPASTNHEANATPPRQTAGRPPVAQRRRSRPDPGQIRMARFGAGNQPLAGPLTGPGNRHQSAPPHAEQQTRREPRATEASPAAAATHGLKTAIPEEWIKPWELRLSREEALYDMRIEAFANNTIIGSIRNLKRRIGSRRAFQKWQSLLSGKSLDEQLWGVRPPAGQFWRPQVREWAQTVLAQAGYDPGVMLPEWEIFWRRKGI
jgi:hypothetical protein